MQKPKRRQTNPITPTKGRPAPPKNLKGEAKDEWERVCDELDQMGTLTTSDRSVLCLYVRVWEQWSIASDKVVQQQAVVLSPTSKTPMQNPWVSIANRAHEHTVKLLGELGLTPRSRSIITKNAAIAGSGDEETADDFADLG